MTVASARVWLSVHLPFRPPLEPFLVQSVLPFVRETLDRGVFSCWFFVRQPDPELHVRLRFRLCSEIDVEEARALLTEQCLRASPYVAQARWSTYEPEHVRYGGEASIEIAESQFRASSDAILAMMASAREWSYGRAFAGALRLHWLLSLAAFPCRLARDDFWKIVEQDWAPFAHRALARFGRPTGDLTTELLARYSEQSSRLVRDLEALIEGDRSGRGPDWARSFREAFERTMRSYEQNGFEFADAAKPGRTHEILQSFVHMTNNRLGLRNEDEACIAFFVRQTLGACAVGS